MFYRNRTEKRKYRISIQVSGPVYEWLLSLGDPNKEAGNLITKLYWNGFSGGVREEQILALAEKMRNGRGTKE
jgi:hypothetical protein